ncbi:MAG: hypothetical protein OXP11_17860 [Gammaproteobacteria bacterium]|nr:hypothetical protein [Gammaproteobacteria bacterium]
MTSATKTNGPVRECIDVFSPNIAQLKRTPVDFQGLPDTKALLFGLSFVVMEMVERRER